MGKRTAEVDTYIGQAKDFAKPILKHLRRLVHRACPDVQESIKWGFPFFVYRGPLCNMAAFKEHVAFGFWKSRLISDRKGYLKPRANRGGEAMGNLGRIISVDALPPEQVIVDFVKQAVLINARGTKSPIVRKKKSPLRIPDFFMSSLQKNKRAFAIFMEFSPTQKREYVEWVMEAKGADTREQRLRVARKWIGEGKVRNWKYIKK